MAMDRNLRGAEWRRVLELPAEAPRGCNADFCSPITGSSSTRCLDSSAELHRGADGEHDRKRENGRVCPSEDHGPRTSGAQPRRTHVIRSSIWTKYQNIGPRARTSFLRRSCRGSPIVTIPFIGEPWLGDDDRQPGSVDSHHFTRIWDFGQDTRRVGSPWPRLRIIKNVTFWGPEDRMLCVLIPSIVYSA